MSDDEVVYCTFHPNVETRLRCNKCGTPICPKCAVQTPVGFRCPQCVRSQQAIFYTATPLDYGIAVVVGLVISALAALILSRVGIFLVIILGPVAGGIIAEVVRWAIGRRRGRWIWLVVSGCIVAGALVATFYPFLFYLFTPQPLAYLPTIFRLDLIIYVALAVGTAYARLR
jgi:MFS family permease